MYKDLLNICEATESSQTNSGSSYSQYFEKLIALFQSDFYMFYFRLYGTIKNVCNCSGAIPFVPVVSQLIYPFPFKHIPSVLYTVLYLWHLTSHNAIYTV